MQYKGDVLCEVSTPLDVNNGSHNLVRVTHMWMIFVIRWYRNLYKLKFISRLPKYGYHYVRTQVHERFAENMKFQIGVITIYCNIFGHNTDKALLTFFPYFVTPVRVFLFPDKFRINRRIP